MRFVEILSADMKLAAIVWQDNSGIVRVSKAGEHECGNYARAWSLPLANVVELAKTPYMDDRTTVTG